MISDLTLQDIDEMIQQHDHAINTEDYYRAASIRLKLISAFVRQVAKYGTGKHSEMATKLLQVIND